jgi:transketolase
MRNILASTLVSYATKPEFVFLTGDLGFMALEPVQQAAGSRFINAGVAEQNMVSVAAGLARVGLKPWVYSIAPFVYARAFEQIRNDVCAHKLPVIIVGNGGGYGYGVMGGTHHSLEDYGALLTLPNLRAYVPAFGADVPTIAARIHQTNGPAYLRLGRDEAPAGFVLPPYAPWRRVLDGSGPTLLIVGPLAGSIIGTLSTLPDNERPATWVLTELPVHSQEIPDAFLADLKRSDHLAVVEEHVAQGSVGQMLTRALMLRGCAPRHFAHRCALGYPNGRYGSQLYHRQQCGLDPESIANYFSG